MYSQYHYSRVDNHGHAHYEKENMMLTEMVKQLKAQTLRMEKLMNNTAHNKMVTEMVEALVEELKHAKAKAHKLEMEKTEDTALLKALRTVQHFLHDHVHDPHYSDVWAHSDVIADIEDTEQFETEDTALMEDKALTARLNILIDKEQDMNEELETMEKLAEILEKHNVDITFVIELAKD